MIILILVLTNRKIKNRIIFNAGESDNGFKSDFLKEEKEITH